MKMFRTASRKACKLYIEQVLDSDIVLASAMETVANVFSDQGSLDTLAMAREVYTWIEA